MSWRMAGFLAATLALIPLAAPAGNAGREPLLFDFTSGARSGWSAVSGSLRVDRRGAHLAAADPGAAIVSPEHLSIDAAVLSRVEIEIRTDPPTGAYLYWTDSGAKGFVPEWRLDLADGRSVLDLSENRAWKGEIDRLLVAPKRGAASLTLARVEVRPPRGVREVTRDGWRRFWRTELRSHYSVNGILGARVGPIPFALLTGGIALLLPCLFCLARGRRFPDAAARHLPRWLFAGALLFLARAAADEVRIASVDNRFFGGRSLIEKITVSNPPGFFPLLLEAKRRIPNGAPVELRASRPYPWEKGGYYLYPSRITGGAPYVISYRTAAPADSTAWDLLFRREGAGSVYRRRER